MNAIEVIKPDSDLSEEKQRADEWLDESLADSFPASDPLPMSHGQAEPADLDLHSERNVG
jgi:hypothetical protein